jgi:aminopeptidase YwaD
MARSRQIVLGTLALLGALLTTGLAPSAPAVQTALRLAQAPSAQVQSPPATSTVFSGAEARQQVEALAVQIGSRPAGSAQYDAAVQYAATQLQQWGLGTAQQAFPVRTYDDRGSSLELTSGGAQTIKADTLTFAAGGQVEAPLIDAGLGQSDPSVDLHGKIALIKRGTLRFGEKVANAAAAGAVGAVVYNDASGPVSGSLGDPQPIPAVTISGEDGEQLHNLVTASPGQISVRLTVHASTDVRNGTNVVAELPGSQPSRGTVVFGAHLDSVPAGPGANDNASGSAVVLQLAHELAQRDPSQRPLTIRFVLFGAEELGLYGSRAYVDSLSEADRQTVVAMINLDMVGVGDAWRFGGTEDLVQTALGAATDLGVRALPLRGPLLGSSDHASFLQAGMPAVFLYRVEDPNYHTANDRAEFVDADTLGQAGTIALRLLDSLSAGTSAS